LAAASGLAFGVAILASLILATWGAGVLDDMPAAERLAAAAAAGVVLAAVMAAPYLGGLTALRGLMARAAWTLRAMPRPRLWL
jgi:hypothetical protein